LGCTGGTQALNFAIYRDLRGPRAGANNHERCLLDVITMSRQLEVCEGRSIRS